jgi:hypothetical protein
MAMVLMSREVSENCLPVDQSGTKSLERGCNLVSSSLEDFKMGRGILLWLLGIPLPIVILLVLFMR